MNRGGFSWKRLIGISRVKSNISRKIGIPLTRSGRNQKIGRMATKGCFGSLSIFAAALALVLFMLNNWP